MNDITRTVNARCLCGLAKHEVTVPISKFPLGVYICHCDSCRHHTGTLCLTVALMPDFYHPSHALLEKLQAYQFSKRISQLFCPTCGTKMMLRILSNGDDPSSRIIYGIPTGTLDQADGVFQILGHEHIQDTLDGGFSDFIPSITNAVLARWPGHFEEHEQLSLPWRSAERSSKHSNSSDRLHGYCKCGSLQFWIARPSDRSVMAKSPWPDVLIPHHSTTQSPPDMETWWLRDRRTKFLAGVCACNSCRLASGVEWVEWAFVPAVDITLDAEGTQPFTLDWQMLKCYRSSSEAKRYFCGNCGAMAFWNGEDRQDLIDVAVGLLNAPEGARAENWLEWTTKRLSFREHALGRAESLVLGVEDGMAAYAERLGRSDISS